MESRSLQLFPTLIKQFREVITEKERLEIIEILKKHNTSDDGLVKGGKSSFNVEYNILSFLGDELSQKIQKMFDEYAQEAGVHQVKIVQSWYSIQDVGGILKEGEMLKPDSSSKIEEGDVIALFALSKDIPEVERLLQVTIDYF